jgi:hypothetical protein
LSSPTRFAAQLLSFFFARVFFARAFSARAFFARHFLGPDFRRLLVVRVDPASGSRAKESEGVTASKSRPRHRHGWGVNCGDFAAAVGSARQPLLVGPGHSVLTMKLKRMSR